MKRAAASIVANVAEGQGRGTPGEFSYLRAVVNGSRCELEALNFLANRRRFLGQSTRDDLIKRSTEVARLSHGRYLGRRPPTGVREDEPTYDEPDVYAVRLSR